MLLGVVGLLLAFKTKYFSLFYNFPVDAMMQATLSLSLLLVLLWERSLIYTSQYKGVAPKIADPQAHNASWMRRAVSL